MGLLEGLLYINPFICALQTGFLRQRGATIFLAFPLHRKVFEVVYGFLVSGEGLHLLRWVHTCNITTQRKAVTLPVTDTIRSYDLNLHPVPHAVTVSCERYTVWFPVCYGSQKHREC
jgi:hypothetical protein